jgi:hypothetical protein
LVSALSIGSVASIFVPILLQKPQASLEIHKTVNIMETKGLNLLKDVNTKHISMFSPTNRVQWQNIKLF